MIAAGRSVLGRPLEARAFGPAAGGGCALLVFGGIHGDEPASVTATLALAAQLGARAPDGRVILVAAVNPDGLATGQQNNARDVDLNRNFAARNWQAEHPPRHFPGTAPLCEPESAWLAALIDDERPRALVALHQPFACVNYDGPARALAEAMAQACGWPAVADIGYPTPGSFGSCYGIDRGLPVITLELPALGDDAATERARLALTVAVEWKW